MRSKNNKSGQNLTAFSAILIAALLIAPILGFPAAVPGIPIWYQDTFLLGCLVVGITGGITAITLWTGLSSSIRWNTIDLGILVLMIYMLIRTGIMEYTPQSSWARISFLFGSYFIARILWSIMDSRRFQQLLMILLVAGILEAVYGLAQLYGLLPSNHSLFAYTGTFPNPGPYSGWLACLYPLAIYVIWPNKTNPRSDKLQLAGWIFLASASLVLVPATSRAAILAAFLATSVVAWPGLKNWRIWRSAWTKGAITVGIFIGLLGLYLLKKDSADGRLLIYKVTTNMISEAPVFGWGWDGFSKMYNNYQSQYFNQGLGSEHEKYLADNVIYGFNEILTFTTEMGLLGLGLLLGIIVLFALRWRALVKSSTLSHIHYLGAGVLVAWGTFSLFSYPLSIPALAVILPVSIAGLNILLYRNNKKISPPMESRYVHENKKLGGVAQKWMYPIVITGLSGFMVCWVVYSKPLTQKWVVANTHQVQKRYDEAILLYDELYPQLDDEGWFLQFAGKSLSLNQQYAKSAQMYERALHFSSDPAIYTTLGQDYTIHGSDKDPSLVTRAEWLLSQVKHMSPYKYYPRYLLAQHYYHTGQLEKAVAEAEQVMNIVPKIASPATNDMRLTMKRLVEEEIFQPERTAIPGNYE